MPNLNDIAAIADALEKCPVRAVQDRCVVVRNRNVTCRKCVEACAYKAITVQANELLIDARACVGCGACSVACPTEAISHLQPQDAVLDETAAKASERTSGVAVIACARISSKGKVAPGLYAEVPCLARVAESTVLKLLADGASEVLLVEGGCETCKFRDAGKRTDKVLDCVNSLLEAAGCTTLVHRTSAFPDDMLSEGSEGMAGSTRRGFFADAVGAAKDTAMTAAKASLEEKLGVSAKPASIGERLRVTEGATLPQLKMPRHDDAVNALYELGASEAPSIVSHLFGSVEIDPDTCNACGMCVMFCPTGALSRAQGRSVDEDLSQIEFSASDCVQCGSCADVCWKGCLSVHGAIEGAQLFDFEPRVFRVSVGKRPPKSFFGNIAPK